MIDNVLNRIKSISNNDISNWIYEYIEHNKESILNLVKTRLLNGESVTNPNDVIGYYKNDSYAKLKKQQNPLAGGTVDLFKTGDFHRYFDITDINENLFRIYSSDEKYIELGKKYGFKQFGLTKEQYKNLLDSTKAYLIEKIFEKILK